MEGKGKNVVFALLFVGPIVVLTGCLVVGEPRLLGKKERPWNKRGVYTFVAIFSVSGRKISCYKGWFFVTDGILFRRNGLFYHGLHLIFGAQYHYGFLSGGL